MKQNIAITVATILLFVLGGIVGVFLSDYLISILLGQRELIIVDVGDGLGIKLRMAIVCACYAAIPLMCAWLLRRKFGNFAWACLTVYAFSTILIGITTYTYRFVVKSRELPLSDLPADPGIAGQVTPSQIPIEFVWLMPSIIVAISAILIYFFKNSRPFHKLCKNTSS